MLDILEDYMNFRGYKYERLDGQISGNIRQDAIDRFSEPDSDRFAFLLTTRAGGVGINLTAADTVIIFDSDWNPQQDIQAQARCHRIGQTKTVKIYRLISKDCYEMEMFKKSSRKLGLDRALLLGIEGSENKKESGPSSEELESLLRYGAYHLMNDQDDVDENVQFQEDIDQILANAKTVQLVGAEEDGAFARVNFLSSNKEMEVNVNDPDFWKKLGVKHSRKKNEFLDRRERRNRGKRQSNESTKAESDNEDRNKGDEGDISDYEVSGSSSGEDSFMEDLKEALTDGQKSSKSIENYFELLIDCMQCYGIEDWTRIAHTGKFDTIDLEELERMGWGVIICCFRYANLKSQSRRLLQLFESKFSLFLPVHMQLERQWLFANHGDFMEFILKIPVHPYLQKQKMVFHLQQSGKQIVERIFNLHCLQLFVKLDMVKDLPILLESYEKCNPHAKWTIAEDEALISCINSFGYGKWESFQSDEKFSNFLGRSENKWPTNKQLEKRVSAYFRQIPKAVFTAAQKRGMIPTQAALKESSKEVKKSSANNLDSHLKKAAPTVYHADSVPTEIPVRSLTFSHSIINLEKHSVCGIVMMLQELLNIYILGQ